jgi:hypothetical protein
MPIQTPAMLEAAKGQKWGEGGPKMRRQSPSGAGRTHTPSETRPPLACEVVRAKVSNEGDGHKHFHHGGAEGDANGQLGDHNGVAVRKRHSRVGAHLDGYACPSPHTPNTRSPTSSLPQA